MTQEHKDLLLKDLCARLPYGVIVEHCSGIRGTLHDLFVNWFYDKNDKIYNREAFTSTFFGDDACDITKFKPYLFPLSSMSEEQREEWQSLMIRDSYGILYHTIDSFDYLYKNHIDVRRLIPMGSAIDATDKNIY